MIDVKIIKKAKTEGSSTKIYTSANSYTGGTAKEAAHASKADVALYAQEAAYAEKADKAQHAQSSYTLDDDTPVKDWFLSKINDDTAAGIITFLKAIKFGSPDSNYYISPDGIANLAKMIANKVISDEIVNGNYQTTNFAEGIIMGKGAKIDNQGDAEMRSLILREFLEVPELRYNRIEIQIGNYWRAPGGGIIENVKPDTDDDGNELTTGIITLHLEDGEIGTIAQDDICMGIFHDGMTTSNNSAVDYDDGIGNFKFSGFFTSYFRVTEILNDNEEQTKEKNITNKRFRYALRPTSDTWRHQMQPCQAMHFVAYGNFSNTERQTSRYSTRTYERYLTGVNNWEFGESNIAAQFGDLSNLTVQGTPMSGYSAYLTNIYMSGTIEQLDSLPYRLEIDNEGDNFLAWGESCHIRCKLYKGFNDETDTVTKWTITRDTADAPSDAVWNQGDKALNFNGSIDIEFSSTSNDLGSNPLVISTVFTITAYTANNTAAAQASITI